MRPGFSPIPRFTPELAENDEEPDHVSPSGSVGRETND